MTRRSSRRGGARPAAPPLRSNPSPTRLPQTPADVALWVGYQRQIAANGHSYGPGLWGGN